jgi:hypothetical protein
MKLSKNLSRSALFALSLFTLMTGCQTNTPHTATQSEPQAYTSSGFQTLALPRASTALNIAMEVHVENSMLPTPQETDYILNIAQAAYAAGVTLSFGLGIDFLNDYTSSGTITTREHGSFSLDSLVATLQAQNHIVSLHADVPESATYSEIVSHLQTYVNQLNSAGGQGRIASGVCNEASADGGWVKGALDAGVHTVAGVVRYCQGSLSNSHPEYIAPETCTPMGCHEAAPMDDPAQRAAGWFTQQTANWIDPSNPSNARQLKRSLFIVGSFGDANVPCLAEAAAGENVGRTCDDRGLSSDDRIADDDYSSEAQGQADAAAFLTSVQEVLNTSLSGTSGDAYHSAFSTNEVVSNPWLTGFFGSLGSAATGSLAGQISFSTLDAVAQLNRSELGLTSR